MVPPINLQDFLVILGKCPVRLSFPKDSCAGTDKIVVEHALVEGPCPPPAIQSLQTMSALLHAVKAVLLLFGGRLQVVFECRATYELPTFLALAFSQNLVVLIKDFLQETCHRLQSTFSHCQ